MPEPTVIAVCGKGGVGKTSVSAGLVKILCEEPARRVLAIDADPAEGLAAALGLAEAVEHTVDDLRTGLIARLGSESREQRRRLLADLDYELLEALVERDNLALLSIGRPERSGCFCSVNDLLRDLIAALAGGFDVVVIDGEAGIEQLNRRVMEKVSRLILVSDPSARGLKVVRTLHTLSREAITCETVGLVINRLTSAEELAELQLPAGLPLLGTLPEDRALRDADRRGRPLLKLPEAGFVAALRAALGGL